MDLQNVCYCLISPTMKRFRCAVWHRRWIRVELALEWLNCTFWPAIVEKKKYNSLMLLSWTLKINRSLLHGAPPSVFSRRDSWIAVVSAHSVRRSLLGTAFYFGAGSKCRLAWQITLKRFPPTSRSKNMCVSAVPCLHLIRQKVVNMPPDN